MDNQYFSQNKEIVEGESPNNQEQSGNNKIIKSIFKPQDIFLKVIVFLNSTLFLTSYILLSVYFLLSTSSDKYSVAFGWAIILQTYFVCLIAILYLRINQKKRPEKSVFDINYIKILTFLGSSCFVFTIILGFLLPQAKIFKTIYLWAISSSNHLTVILLYIFLISAQFYLANKIIWLFFKWDAAGFIKKQFDFNDIGSNFTKQPALVYFPLIIFGAGAYFLIKFINHIFSIDITRSSVVYIFFGFSFLYLHITYLSDYYLELKKTKNIIKPTILTVVLLFWLSAFGMFYYLENQDQLNEDNSVYCDLTMGVKACDKKLIKFFTYQSLLKSRLGKVNGYEKKKYIYNYGIIGKPDLILSDSAIDCEDKVIIIGKVNANLYSCNPTERMNCEITAVDVIEWICK